MFDLDGTLVDTEQLWLRAIVDWLADCGQNTTVEALAPVVIGHSWIDIHAAIHNAFPSLPGTSSVDDAVKLRPYYERHAADPASQVIDGSVAFLKKVARRVPCVIVSGSPHADVEEAARLCGVNHLLRFVLGCEDCGRGKPAPDGFLKAASMLDVDASECVVVEDSTAGVAAGRAAGMHVIGIDRNVFAPQNLVGCDWLVHDLSEIDPNVVFE